MKEVEFKYGGARALTQLHERHLRSFFKTWQEAKTANIKLPETNDADYASLEHVLRHALSSARGYMVWICKCLDLADPDIKPTPATEVIAQEAEAYMEHVLERWQYPLREVDPSKFYRLTFESNWGVPYCIDAMLEHAVMHPVRHEFQLRNLLEASQKIS